MEKLLITGSTGFIGTKLTLYLAKLGYQVHALHRPTSDTSKITHPNIHLFKGDISNKESLETAMKGCNGVFHLAAFAKQWSKDKNKFYDINYIGTLNVLEAAKKLNVKKVIYTSTAGVIGPSKEKSVNENTKRTVDFFFEYEKTKWMAEQKIQDFVKGGLDITIVNPTRVYGPGILSESNGVTKIIKQYSEGKWHILPGNGKKIGNYVYVDDVVKGHHLAYVKGVIGEKYILGGTNISYENLFKIIVKITNKKYFLLKIPAFIILFIARINMLITYITGKGPRIIPASAKKILFNWSVSSDKAINELGYQPTPISKGIQKTLYWLNNA